MELEGGKQHKSRHLEHRSDGNRRREDRVKDDALPGDLVSERAVVDRFEDGKAVLLVADEERQMIVDRSALPFGTKEGDWLRITIQDGLLAGVQIDEAETEAARLRIADKLERLRRGEHLQS